MRIGLRLGVSLAAIADANSTTTENPTSRFIRRIVAPIQVLTVPPQLNGENTIIPQRRVVLKPRHLSSVLRLLRG